MNIEEAFKRKFFTNDNFFPTILEQRVVKPKLKNLSLRETGQSGQIPLLPPNKPKTTQ